MTKFAVEVEQEEDGRWMAEVLGLPGTMAYGGSEQEAVANAEALALRVLAELNEPYILSESALSDWLKPEEDEAWKYLNDLPELPANDTKAQDDTSN